LPKPLLSVARRSLRSIMPPFVVAGIRRLRHEWVYAEGGWPVEEDVESGGWAASGVVESYRAGFASFRAAIRPQEPLGIPHEVHAGQEFWNNDPPAHNLVLTYGYVLARAARSSDRVSVLDWGGGLGNYYLLSRELLPEVELDYHCKEVAPIAAAGRLELPQVTFHDSDSCLNRRYDLVLVSSSLHYEENWQSRLAALAGAAGRYLYIARLPVALDGGSFVVVQRPYRRGYATEYAGWVLGREEFLHVATGVGLVLEREFLSEDSWKAPGAPSETVSRSYLFRRA
jgi:putative methyltransferase (TIGR04325 family)